jgi:DNA-directed RNA polymerase subunit M/transcription elongation factor TFIIS
MPSKKTNTEPFVARVRSMLDKTDTMLIYPVLRVECAKDLRSVDLEEEIYAFCNGLHRLYVPLVQFALAHKDDDQREGTVIDAYTRTINNDVQEASCYIDPVDTAIEAIKIEKFATTVVGCNKNAKRCPGCHSTNNIDPYARQTQSADEGDTIFYICGNPKCPRRGTAFK